LQLLRRCGAAWLLLDDAGADLVLSHVGQIGQNAQRETGLVAVND
jgi:hypothetical protein